MQTRIENELASARLRIQALQRQNAQLINENQCLVAIISTIRSFIDNATRPAQSLAQSRFAWEADGLGEKAEKL